MTLDGGIREIHLKDADENYTETILSASFYCDECEMPSLRVVMKDEARYALGEQQQIESNHSDGRWLPVGPLGKHFPDVPEHIAEAANEAHQCMSIGAHRAAMSLARAVVEASAKDKGITQGNLYAKIDEMHSQGLVREHVREAAHEVRHLGNDMAHGDFVDPVEIEDAALALELVNEILHEVYQSPAKVARRRAARTAARP